MPVLRGKEEKWVKISLNHVFMVIVIGFFLNHPGQMYKKCADLQHFFSFSNSRFSDILQKCFLPKGEKSVKNQGQKTVLLIRVSRFFWWVPVLYRLNTGTVYNLALHPRPFSPTPDNFRWLIL